MPDFTGEWRKIGEFFVLNISGSLSFAGKPVNGLYCLIFDQKRD
jgi:hypothetical protein